MAVCKRLAKEEKSGRNSKKKITPNIVLVYKHPVASSGLSNVMYGLRNTNDHFPLLSQGIQVTNEAKLATVLVIVLSTQ